MSVVIPFVIMVRVFANGPGDGRSIQGRGILKTQKYFLMSPCLTLSIIKYGSRVTESIQGKEYSLSLHIGVVAIDRESFRSSLTTVCLLICLHTFTDTKNIKY